MLGFLLIMILEPNQIAVLHVRSRVNLASDVVVDCLKIVLTSDSLSCDGGVEYVALGDSSRCYRIRNSILVLVVINCIPIVQFDAVEKCHLLRIHVNCDQELLVAAWLCLMVASILEESECIGIYRMNEPSVSTVEVSYQDPMSLE